MTNKAKQYLKEAKALMADADLMEKSASDLKWEIAERLYKANVEEGVSQKEILSVVRFKSSSSVSEYIRVWKEFGQFERSNRPLFNAALVEVYPGKTREAADERAARTVLSDPARAAKVLDQIEPEAKAAVVTHVARSDKTAMTSAMQDPKARMRAEGASSRAREIARAEAKNERKAAARGGATPDLGAAALFAIGNLMSDGAAWAGRLSDAYEEALRVCSDDQIEAIKGRVRTGSFPITKVLGDITGEGVDAALARMLDTEV